MIQKAMAGLLFLGLAAPAQAAVPVRRQSLRHSYPTLTINIAYPKTGNAAIDRVLAAYAHKREADVGLKPPSKDENPDDREFTSEMTYEIERNDAHMFVITFTGGWYAGGVHGSGYTDSFNFLLPGGQQVFLPELVDGHRGLVRVSELAKAALKALSPTDANPDGDWDWRGTTPLESNFKSFAWRPDRLVVTFAQYQVTGYAGGMPSVEIPMAALRDVIRPDPRLPMPSFSCAKARSATEKAICGDVELSRLDRQVSDHYADALENYRRQHAYLTGKSSSDLDARHARTVAGQRAWLQRRDQCGARRDCLLASYRSQQAFQKTHWD